MELSGHEVEMHRFVSAAMSLKLQIIKVLDSIEQDSQTANSTGDSELKVFDADDLMGIDVDGVKREIHKLEEHLKTLTPNLNAIQNYRELVRIFSLFLFFLMMNHFRIGFINRIGSIQKISMQINDPSKDLE